MTNKRSFSGNNFLEGKRVNSMKEEIIAQKVLDH